MTECALHEHRPGGRPTTLGSEQLSLHILAIAQRLFLRDGLARTSMDAIAVAAGISKRTLYVRHASKQALFEAVVLNFIEAGAAQIMAVHPAGAGLADRLRAFAEQILAVATAPQALAMDRLVTGAAVNFPHLAELLYQQGKSRLQGEVMAMLTQAGMQASALDAEIFLSMVILPPLRRAALRQSPPGLAGVDRIFLTRTIEIFVAGLGSRS